tara:strand:+ start:1575 stop:1718 length:144 start_codon:yes stop_codon:yes gene_type:complete
MNETMSVKIFTKSEGRDKNSLIGRVIRKITKGLLYLTDKEMKKNITD